MERKKYEKKGAGRNERSRVERVDDGGNGEERKEKLKARGGKVMDDQGRKGK